MDDSKTKPGTQLPIKATPQKPQPPAVAGTSLANTAAISTTPTSTNGGGDPTTIGILSPRPNAAVVGANPGVPVLVEGTVDGPLLPKNLWVKVSLGGAESSAFNPDSSGSWSYSGLTAQGGNITIWATLYSKSSTGVFTEITASSVAVTVNNNPALSATITSPANGATIRTWVDSTTASGAAAFDATINSRQVLISVSGGPARSATLGAGTPSGSQTVYTWSCPLVFSQPSQNVQISAIAAGTFTDSQGRTTNVSSQTPSVVTVSVDIDTTAPALTVMNPPADFQTPNVASGTPLTVTGTATDFDSAGHLQSGVKSIVIGGDVVAPVTAQLTQTGQPANTWGWTAAVTLPPIITASDRGQRILSVTALDNANNPRSLSVSVYLQAPFQPFDRNDSLSLLAYLGDLIFFATRRISDPTKYPAGNLETADLARNFYQPFDRLSSDEEVHQTRLAIEVLRKWLAPIGYWKFDENAGTLTADVSGNNLNGTLQGAAAWGPGKSGSAVSLDGATGYVQVGNAAQLRVTTALSIAAWIFPTGPGSANLGGAIVCKEGEYELARYADGSIQWAFANTKPGWNWINTQFIAPLNQWTHIVVRYASGVVNTYANGQLVHSYFGAGAIGSVDPNNHDFRIGARQAVPQFFQGRMDEVNVFDRVLSTEEISALFQGTIAASLVTAQAAYRLSAYQTILLKLGTSYEELRLARAADAATRAALAARLGIDLESSRPDKLDKLVLSPSAITEAKLEQLFGLVDTTHNPLNPPSAQDPDLLAWQKTHLRSVWRLEDYPANADPLFPTPLIDPDLLVQDDFNTSGAPTPNYALNLWTARTTWVNQQMQALAADHQPGENDQARLNRLVGLKLSPVTMANLLTYNTAYTQGTKIDSNLNPIPLSFAAFSYLVRLYNLAGLQQLLDDEWNAVYSILVQVMKARLFSTWSSQEANPAPGSAPIIVDPTYFQFNSDFVTPPDWRATAQTRFAWQNKLASRISQLESLAQALEVAAQSTEEATLSQLRDALLAAVRIPVAVPTLFSSGIVANGLTLADGAIDSHWTITATPSGAASASAYATLTKYPVTGPWLANSSTSRWISPQPDESVGDAQGAYTYKTTFDLTGFDPASVRIGVQVAVDDSVTAIKLNGQSLGFTAVGYAAFVQTTITGGFLAGINTLEILMTNGAPSPNPSGLRVEFTSTGMAQASADWISERLLIDVGSAGAIKTTRVSQAIETLQEILYSVRTFRFGIPGNLGKIASWTLSTGVVSTDFDADWTWMGTYATWRAAMEVFLYPENVLSPSYLRPPSAAFSAVLDYLRKNPPLSESLASLVANLFSNYAKAFPAAPDPQAQNWADGFADIQKLILGTLPDQELQRLRDTIQPALFTATTATPPTPATSLARTYWDIFYFVPVQLGLQLQLAGRFEDALNCFRAVYAYHLTSGAKKIFRGLKAEEQPASPGYARADNWARGLDPHEAIAPTRPNAYTRFTLMSIARCFLDFADSEFTHDTPESVSKARELYLDALELLALPEMQALNTGFQANPIPIALQNHALNSLMKLRNGLNIAGARRIADPSIASAGGTQSDLSSTPAPQPTPYKYATLIDRAKQLNQLAQQVENSYFAALQQQDAESYNLLKANQDLELAGANLDLQVLQITEANDEVSLATDQTTRAQTQFNTYNNWINAGPLQSEDDMIQQYQSANDARNWSEGLGAAMTAAQALVTASSGGFLGTGIGAGYAPALIVSGLAVGKAAADIAANNASTQAQIDAANASFERRLQEWQLQKSLAQNDLTIGHDQIKLATDKVQIATQQSAIATIQDNHAQAIVNFLNTKFTNVELYEWMSGVLGGVYRYLLQQSTAMAQLAETQLSFERQQPMLAVIKADYWQPPSQSTAQTVGTAQTDRQGLTGSARLLQDITQLDQYAFLTDSRKLQLTKTISLSRLVPFEFQQFRETGILPFATPAALFDQDFPGHYLRLVKRVRVSLVALVPPNQGIKAGLTTTGISRVTLGGDVFQTVAVQRNPESIALTSPLNATGLFELDAQPELLLPFEGTGVDTSWEFRMPLAANLFDYSTIADVILSMDYTALDSPDFRQQVVKQLTRGVSLDRAFSFRQDLADQWYDLNNPDQLAVPFTVQFSTSETDFPPNIDNLAIQNILLHFVHADNQHFEISNVSLTSSGSGGSANTVDSTISIRRGNASAWQNLVGKPPIQAWTLVLPDTPDTSAGPGTRTLFQTGVIQDILLVITYTGTLPAWDS